MSTGVADSLRSTWRGTDPSFPLNDPVSDRLKMHLADDALKEIANLVWLAIREQFPEPTSKSVAREVVRPRRQVMLETSGTLEARCMAFSWAVKRSIDHIHGPVFVQLRTKYGRL